MPTRRDYGIELPKLKVGAHQFTFRVQDAFFADQEASPIEVADIEARVDLDKSLRQIDTRFTLTGWMQLECDRCLQQYRQPVDTEFRIVYSFDRELGSSDDTEIIAIDRNVPFLDFTRELYDYIILQIPMKQVPPDCPTDACTRIIEQFEAAAEAGPAEEDGPVDSRWASLQELRSRFASDNPNNKPNNDN